VRGGSIDQHLLDQVTTSYYDDENEVYEDDYSEAIDY
jgi:hypothetical protein